MNAVVTPPPTEPTPPPAQVTTTPSTPEPAPTPAPGSLVTTPPPAPVAPAPEPLTLEALKAPEGKELDPELGKSLVDLFNKDMPAAERANALLELQAKAGEKLTERLVTQWDELQTQWQEEVKKDPEIGGDKLEPILGNIAKLLSDYPRQEEFKALLTASGMGNHIEGVRFMKWVAERLSEGRPVTGSPAVGIDDLASRMYPTMKTS